MPRLPGSDSHLPAPNPGTGVATITTIDRRNPSMRAPIGDLGAPARAEVQAGEQLTNLGTALEAEGQRQEAERRRLEIAVKHEQERQDTIRAEDAYTRLRQRQLDLTTGEGGYATTKGEQAVKRPLLKEYTAQFADQVNAIAEGLGNENQKRLFSQRAAVSALQFEEGILHHVIRENDAYAKQVFEGIMTVEQRAATSNWSSPAEVQASITRIEAAVADRAERGSWPSEYTEATRLKEVGAIHSAVVAEAMASGNVKYAQDWFEAHKDDVDKNTAARLQSAVRDGTQRQTVAMYTTMLQQARNSPEGLDELERRVNSDQTLDDTRRTALTGSILARKDALAAALDRQDAKNERARERWERQVERAVDRVRSSLAFGEPSMQQLEPLINATRNTTMAPEVDALVRTANATRQFRFAPAITQEATLNAMRGAMRTDPTKVDAQMLNTLQGIFDGQQRQLKESGISFAISQGLVDPANPAVKPMDTSKPETITNLPQRMQLAHAVTDQYKAPLKPLTPEERDLAVATLTAGDTTQRREWFAAMSRATGGDIKAYSAIMAQIAPDQPVLAIAGVAAQRRYDDGKGQMVADLMLRGHEILNPPRRADGRPDGGTLIPMPAETKMRLDFDNYTREAFAGNAAGRSDYYQAAKAIYAAKSAASGDKDTTQMNSNRWAESITLATGGIEKINGVRLIMPWGVKKDKFLDGLYDRVSLLEANKQLPEGVSRRQLLDMPLQPVGDGKYVFRNGDSVVTSKPEQGRPAIPIVVDFNQALPWIPSGSSIRYRSQ